MANKTSTVISDSRIGASDYGQVFSVDGNIGNYNTFAFTDSGAVQGALEIVSNVSAQASENTTNLTDKTLAALAKLTGENTEGGQNKMFVWLAVAALVAFAYVLTHRK